MIVFRTNIMVVINFIITTNASTCPTATEGTASSAATLNRKGDVTVATILNIEKFEWTVGWNMNGKITVVP